MAADFERRHNKYKTAKPSSPRKMQKSQSIKSPQRSISIIFKEVEGQKNEDDNDEVNLKEYTDGEDGQFADSNF